MRFHEHLTLQMVAFKRKGWKCQPREIWIGSNSDAYSHYGTTFSSFWKGRVSWTSNRTPILEDREPASGCQ